jgi:ferrochelatase
VSSRRVQELLQERLRLPVELGMRYQSPSIEGALAKLIQQGVKELLLIPLFPHYAMSSFETAVERVKELLKKMSPDVALQITAPYYDHPGYIEALAARTEPYLSRSHDHLLFSFHGVPERHLHKADPTGCQCLKSKNCCEIPSPAHATCYRAQCLRTARALADRMLIPQGDYSVSFQSRLGRDPWLQPYTDHELARLAESGVKRLLVICPAFVTDCLETLEEIGIRGRETFLAAGGQEFELIPCLNDHPRWISFLEGLIRDFEGALEEEPVLCATQ